MRFALSLPLLCALLVACEPSEPAVTSSNPSILPTTSSMASRGSDSGSNNMGYTGYRVSEILDELSDLPVQYQADNDPRVDFKFQYPDLNPETAKSEAIRSLVDYVNGHTDTLDVATDGYLLTPAPTFGQRPSVSPGTKLRIEGQTVQADKLSIGELAEVLREERSETYFVDKPACCTTVSFERDASLAALQQQLVEVSGVYARPVNRMVATLRVSDR